MASHDLNDASRFFGGAVGGGILGFFLAPVLGAKEGSQAGTLIGVVLGLVLAGVAAVMRQVEDARAVQEVNERLSERLRLDKTKTSDKTAPALEAPRSPAGDRRSRPAEATKRATGTTTGPRARNTGGPTAKGPDVTQGPTADQPTLITGAAAEAEFRALRSGGLPADSGAEEDVRSRLLRRMPERPESDDRSRRRDGRP